MPDEEAMVELSGPYDHWAHNEIEVGDRVFVMPVDRVLQVDWRGWGTVEKVLGDDGYLCAGALYVRLDKNGEVLGCGRDAIVGVQDRSIRAATHDGT